MFFFLYFCRTLSQSGEGQVRSPADGIPKGNVSCVVFIIALVRWFPDDWMQQFLFVIAIWCEWKRKYVNSPRQPSWGRLLRDTGERKEVFRARGATCESTIFFFCDSRRRFLCLDVCVPPPPPGSDVHAARRFFRFSSLCVSVFCGFCSSVDAASPLLYVCFVIVFFICLSSACMHSPSDLVFSGLLQPENIVLTLQVKLCTLDLRRHSLPCSHRV